ncbi:hypothetical protein M3Y97_00301800 [Aphelenchoides bicaudatus]|nr:hypothetical protein M3Y97_00301800 [Aphelenchoides bicaudatus]
MERGEKMFPVRVVVESVRPNHCLTCAHEGQTLVDTYTIINQHTQLHNVVETVLSALGMPHLIQDSRGLIQINNWKPIPFESITDNQEDLAANLFKEISSNVTLKILTKHGALETHSATCIMQLKDRILKMALDKQPQLLQMVDNHEIKNIVQQVVAGADLSLNETQIQAINEWMDNLAENATAERKSPRSSIRFSPVSEIPLLNRWFKSDPNPSRQTLVKHMNQLNGAPYRRSNPKVSYQQLCNWFSNQRANSREIGASTVNSIAQQLSQANASFQWPSASTAATSVASMLGQSFNLAALSGQTTTSNPSSPPLPLASQPDIRSKFDRDNSYTPLLDRQNEAERMEGGSESPINDDASEHSASENCGYDADIKGSIVSSPELSLDMNAFSPAQQSNTPTLNSQAAAALSALQQFVPISLSSSLNGFQSLDTNALAQFAAAAQSQALSTSTAQALLNSSLSNSRHTDDEHHSGKRSSTNPATPQQQQNGQTARSRLMFDPLSELPILERWFEENPHPGWLQIEQYTDSLNSLQYRQNYPPISTHNVKIWFKNRRAKCKRLLTGDQPTQAPSSGKIALSAN